MKKLAGPAGFHAQDLDLLTNYPGIPPKAPQVVTSLLRNPGSIDSLVPALRRDILDTAHATIGGLVGSGSLWKWIDAPEPEKSPDGRAGYLAMNAGVSLREFVAALSPAEQAFLAREVPPLFRPSVEDTLLNPIEREIERLQSDATTDSIMGLADKLPMQKLANASRDLEGALSFLTRMLQTEGIKATIAYLEATRLKTGIPVAIGTKGNDVHRLHEGIVFDPGGNDRYEFPDSVRPGSWLMVVDVSGNDTYVARDSVGGAAAFLSVQLITDLAGNDRYVGKDFAFGSALMGFSRLYDAKGDDEYVARCGALGFAFRGIGILQDAAGKDSYSSAYLSQGASSSFGLGLLLDEEGNDRYDTRPVFVDDLRYRDHFLSMSQGFSSGFSPGYAGGLGILWDQEGNDTYLADIFGQGTGYWFAWGLLMDDAGNDRFNAYQYAQGAGVHFAVGTLLDASGEDARVSKGVSQGCGHDGGFGMLFDAAGDDSTTAVDMSAGAGSANGLGVYLDIGGNDAYTMGNPLMTLGHGDMRRDKGSLGFFLDLEGHDAYSNRLESGSVRRVYDG
ncbi:MAG TPA: hypothetical protein VHO02_00450, partial [Fibrobacteria bacterium]|nr:hypothetical protein [Fibrobacteria bacterium]